MSHAPDHDPGQPPTNWSRLVLGLVGLLLGLGLVFVGLRSFG